MSRARVRASALSPRLIAVLALIGAAVPIGTYLWAAAHRLDYPYELDWLEGGTVELVGRALHGQPLYAAPNLGYAGFTYTPLFFYLAAGVAKLTGVSFLPLRIVSLAFSLVSFAALFLYVRHATGRPVAGVVAAGLFGATYGLTGWFYDVGRADSMYVALSLVTLWLGRRSQTVAAGMLVGLVGFLAFFTKQTGLIAVGPALVAAALARPRAGVAALGTLVVLAGASTLLLDALTHGWYRYYIVGELAGQPSVPKLYGQFWSLYLYHHLHWLTLLAALALVVALASGAATALANRRGQRTGAAADAGASLLRRLMPLLRWPYLYDLAAGSGLIVAAWVSLVHSGSYYNVMMPGYAACAGIAGCAYGILACRAGLIGAVVALALFALQVDTLVHHEVAHRAIPTAKERHAGAELEAVLRRLRGPVLVLRHPWYGTVVGKGAFAQADGLQEILRSQNPKGRTELTRALAGSLNRDHIQAVVLDALPPPPWLAPQLARDFRLFPGALTLTPLRPVADLRSSPTYLYLRRAGAR
jgi:hypothetical protein